MPAGKSRLSLHCKSLALVSAVKTFFEHIYCVIGITTFVLGILLEKLLKKKLKPDTNKVDVPLRHSVGIIIVLITPFS